jgi:hypothetical protein
MLKAIIKDAKSNPEKLLEYSKTFKPRDLKVSKSACIVSFCFCKVV